MENIYINKKQVEQPKNAKKKVLDTKYIQFDHAKSVKLKTLNEVAKSLCQIKIKDKKNGTGFFLKINTSNNTLYMLVTAHHVVRYPYGDKKLEIEIITDVGNIKRKIKLDKNERKMIFLGKKESNNNSEKETYDISGIEIIGKDNLKDKVKFLDYDLNCRKKNYSNYKGKDTFILHHPNGIEDLTFSSGKILEIKEHRSFSHSLDTDQGSSGSPILLIDNESDNPKVIAIHTSADTSTNDTNIGLFINVLTRKLNE